MPLNATHEQQHQLCRKYNAEFFRIDPTSKVGIALNVRTTLLPINGLRHPSEGDTCGWYIWSGEELSEADDFFVPLHVSHLPEWCPEILKFLGLPPGWRFFKTNDYEDVWFDASLLEI